MSGEDDDVLTDEDRAIRDLLRERARARRSIPESQRESATNPDKFAGPVGFPPSPLDADDTKDRRDPSKPRDS